MEEMAICVGFMGLAETWEIQLSVLFGLVLRVSVQIYSRVSKWRVNLVEPHCCVSMTDPPGVIEGECQQPYFQHHFSPETSEEAIWLHQNQYPFHLWLKWTFNIRIAEVWAVSRANPAWGIRGRPKGEMCVCVCIRENQLRWLVVESSKPQHFNS